MKLMRKKTPKKKKKRNKNQKRKLIDTPFAKYVSSKSIYILTLSRQY